MTTLPFPLTQHHYNKQLFSDYYLNVILPQRTDWQELANDPAVHTALADMQHIWQAYTPSNNEAQTEHDFIRPLLTRLGHTFAVQPSLTTPDGTKRPDYVLYRDQAAVVAQLGLPLTEELLQHTAIAVADAKYWERPLDNALPKSGGDPFNNRNPSYQIDFYLRHSGVRWGILTNGRLWRLYHRDSSKKLDRFYEVDVPHVLELGQPEVFLYFYAFFRRAAFDEHPLGIETIRQESIQAAQGISDSIYQQVYTALRHLAQGFLNYAPNTFHPDTETINTINDHSLIVLYRLLFILYAESRNLLPLRTNILYRDYYSLAAIALNVAQTIDQQLPLPQTSAVCWCRLHELFAIISKGSPPLTVAIFNGGLFDPQRYPFLEHYGIGDAWLHHALDLLTRVAGQFVDYRDLAERHLGTIYEGLLEHHLRPIPPEGDWTIDLFNDKGERKITGSYYTPDFIVDYMVEQAIQPVLAAALAKVSPDPGAISPDAAKIAALLNISVADPSMGSGHFLVSATEYIARFLVDLDIAQEDSQQETDIAYWKRRVAQNCIYGVDLNPLAVDLAKLSLWIATVAKGKPLSFLDHHLRCGNALVGVRLDQMRPTAVSAKQTHANQQHAATNGQLSMLADDVFRESMQVALDTMGQLERTANDTIDDVRKQEQLYGQMREQLTIKYGKIADLTTATHFGVAMDTTLWNMLYDYTTGRLMTIPPQLDHYRTTADEQAKTLRFFHWELEFPEVFFAAQGQPLSDQAGFDVVLGNPPYVRQERIMMLKPYLQTRFVSYNGVADLYVYFYEQSLNLLKDQGRMTYISSGTFTRSNFAKPFRTWLTSVAHLETLIDFGENQPFKGAEMVRPTIVVLRKEQSDMPFRSLFLPGTSLPESLKQAVIDDGIDCEVSLLQKPEWVFQTQDIAQTAEKVLSTGTPLKELVHDMYCGVKTGLNEAFIIDKATRQRLIQQDPHAAELIKPLVRGRDMRPWYQKDEGLHLIFMRRGLALDDYPAIKAHLLAFRERLEPKPADWTGRKWQGRKRGTYQWYEVQDPINYHTVFEHTKLFWPAIGKLPRFSLDERGYYTNDSGYFIPTDDMFLLGILQSRVIWFAIAQICTPLRLRGGLWQYQQFIQFIARLPIPDVPADVRDAIGSLAQTITTLARARYTLHKQAQHRVLTDFGAPGAKLNQKLTAWWELDFPTFHAQIQTALNTKIAVSERGEWEEWLQNQRLQHQQYTEQMIAAETELNTLVYQAFDLTPTEIQLIEERTEYAYGEV